MFTFSFAIRHWPPRWNHPRTLPQTSRSALSNWWWGSKENCARGSEGEIPTAWQVGLYVQQPYVTVSKLTSLLYIYCVFKDRHFYVMQMYVYLLPLGCVFWGLWSIKMSVEFLCRVIFSSTHLWLKLSAWLLWKQPAVGCRFVARSFNKWWVGERRQGQEHRAKWT